MAGIGNNFVTTSLSNCFVLPSPLDSYSGIMRTDEEQVRIMKRGAVLDMIYQHLEQRYASQWSYLRRRTGATYICIDILILQENDSNKRGRIDAVNVR